MADIKTLDLNLLKALDALLETRSVTRAADRLGLTQPAVSGMLTRLREAFGDPLFIRTQRGVLPTPRALALAEPLRAALSQMQALLTPHVFEPMEAEMTLAIAATDYAQKAVLLPFMANLRRQAPRIRLSIRPVEGSQFQQQLENGTLDMALVTPEMAPETLRARRLFEETYLCVFRKNHPAATLPLTLEQFCAADHAIMSHDGTQFRGATDRALEDIGLQRNVVASLPSFLILIEMLRQSDLIALLPSRLLDGVEGLNLCPPPIDVPGFTKILVWHERLQHDPAHEWLRRLMASSVA